MCKSQIDEDLIMTTECTTTPRKHFSPRQRLAIWEAHKGVCCICGEKIDGTRGRWLVEHVRALGLAGTNDTENLAPAHEQCAKQKTRNDIKRIAKAKRQKAKHLGIRNKSKWPLQDKFKKCLDGSVIDRRTGEKI